MARLRFNRVPQGKELPDARALLEGLPSGCLCIADALYGIPKWFATLAEHGLFGLARHNRRCNLVMEKRLSQRRHDGGWLEEHRVRAGTSHYTDKQTLRLIRFTKKGRRHDLLTNVLDPDQLSAAEALDLYRSRWTVERLFYDLKEVLNLHCFYAANVNAIAMQVFAAAIVHTALRVAQGRIALEARIEPELISVEKLFPKVAAASYGWTAAECTFDATCEANPQATLVKPSWSRMRFAKTTLGAILVEKRNGRRRRKKRRCVSAERSRKLPRPPRRPRK
jgi:hypothetical protein